METATYITNKSTPVAPPTALVKPKPPQKTVHWILGVCFGLGIVGDLLLRSAPLGINAAIYVCLLCLCLARSWKRYKTVNPCWDLLIAVTLFGLCMAWRDASVLRIINITTILILLAILCARPSRLDVYSASFASLGRGIGLGTGESLASPLALLFQETNWEVTSKAVHVPVDKPMMRGIAIAVPLLLIFGCLFAAADAVFRHVTTTLLENVMEPLIQNPQWLQHIFFVPVFMCLAIAFIRPGILGQKWSPAKLEPKRAHSLSKVEISIVMVSIILLFLVFIGVQFRYLFGGDDLVQSMSGLTYAEYARQGFFALLIVVSLVHGILLVGMWLVCNTPKHVQSLFRQLSLALMALTAVIFVSAFYRLSLYIQAYGLTQSRFYAGAILIWLAIAFLILATRMAKPQIPYFMGAYLYSLLLAVLMLNIANPDATIAGNNLTRPHTAAPLDLEYLAGLSADAVPTLLKHKDRWINEEPPPMFLSQYKESDKTDWRTWNWSRAKAEKLLSIEY